MQLRHEQVYIKVNARCDIGVAPLVVALNEINGVETYESCQNMGEGYGACVFFTYKESEQQLHSLLQEMSARLVDQGSHCDYFIRLEWFANNPRPRAYIVLAPVNVIILAEEIRRMAFSLNARMSELGGDR